jgi:predicted enzyme related to lactoylglutathione lyase
MLRGLTTVTYQAPDLAAARQWYTTFLGIEPYFARPEYIEFRVGDYEHEFGILDGKYREVVGLTANPDTAPSGVIAYWHVDDIEATLKRLLVLGARQLQAPRDFGQGFIGATVLDPFGNVLGLMYNPHYLAMLNGDEDKRKIAPQTGLTRHSQMSPALLT